MAATLRHSVFKLAGVMGLCVALAVVLLGVLVSIWSSDALSAILIQSNSSMIWGSYRPNLYAALSTKTPAPVVAGLMWFVTSGIPDAHRHLRHACEQGQVGRYGWKVHDGATFGTHEIVDAGATLTTSFVKHEGGDKGGEWTLRVKGEGPKGSSISLFFYVRNEEEAVKATGMTGPKKKGLDRLRIDSHHSALGSFSVFAKEGANSPPADEVDPKYKLRLADLGKVHYVSAWLRAKDSWRVRDLVNQALEDDFRARIVPVWTEHMQDERRLAQEGRPTTGKHPFVAATLSDKALDTETNVVVVQRILEFPFEIDFNFVSHNTHTNVKPDALQETIGAALGEEIARRTEAFERRFETQNELAAKSLSAQEKNLARAAMSSLIGSIGYFYGDWRQRVDENTTAMQPVSALYTAVPSRSFFPRGFLWDEGFHEILISRWDPSISVEVISHWLNVMTDDGWIAREQILGDEARSRVPSEFVVQNPLHANPPTLLLAIFNLIRMHH